MLKKIKIQNVILNRQHPKLGEIITWEIHSADGKVRLGVIRQLNDQWRKKIVGWQEFPIKYWLGSKFYPFPSKMVVANTRKEVIELIKTI